MLALPGDQDGGRSPVVRPSLAGRPQDGGEDAALLCAVMSSLRQGVMISLGLGRASW